MATQNPITAQPTEFHQPPSASEALAMIQSNEAAAPLPDTPPVAPPPNEAYEAVKPEVMDDAPATGATPPTDFDGSGLDTTKIHVLPSGLQYVVKPAKGRLHTQFQKMVLKNTNGGKRPDAAIDCINWLITQLVQIYVDGRWANITLDGLEDELSFLDAAKMKAVVGELLPSSSTEETS